MQPVCRTHTPYLQSSNVLRRLALIVMRRQRQFSSNRNGYSAMAICYPHAPVYCRMNSWLANDNASYAKISTLSRTSQLGFFLVSSGCSCFDQRLAQDGRSNKNPGGESAVPTGWCARSTASLIDIASPSIGRYFNRTIFFVLVKSPAAIR